MGRFNKVTPSKGFNSNQSDRSGSSGKTKPESELKMNTKRKDGKPEKKPFDKKTWRLQKYSKKYKLEQWEEKRKKAILRGYYKEMKDDKPKIDVQKIYEQYDSDNEEKRNFVQNLNLTKRSADDDVEITEETSEVDVPGKGQKSKNKAYNKAKLEFERLKEEKVVKKEERMKQKQEREEALKVYKQKKNEKYKKLNKKTKRGQPVMKDRIEMLLEKIQSKSG